MVPFNTQKKELEEMIGPLFASKPVYKSTYNDKVATEIKSGKEETLVVRKALRLKDKDFKNKNDEGTDFKLNCDIIYWLRAIMLSRLDSNQRQFG